MSRSGGFSEGRLARLAEVLDGYVGRGEVAGLTALLARRDEVQVLTFGVQDLAGGAPIARDTIFRLASVTKPITAAAAMILVEEATIRLDDPVERWLPELADRQVLRTLSSPLDDVVPAERSITVRDLLTFRLGLGAVMAPPDSYPIQTALAAAGAGPGPSPLPMTGDEYLRRLGDLPLIHQPGAQWMYDTGSNVLGVLIARAAGQPLDVFMEERLFEPLGMVDTDFHCGPEQLPRLATAYQRGADGGLDVWDRAEGGLWSHQPSFHAGSAGLVSTVDDLLAFSRMMLGHGRAGADRILGRTTVEAMTTDQLTAEQKARSAFYPGFWDSRGWGLGMSVVTRRDGPAASPGAYGWDGGYTTSWRCDPREELAGVLLAQRLMTAPNDSAIIDDFWTLAYQALMD